MRIAFYAPLKSPTHPVPSGDRRVARLLVDALGSAGHRVELASTHRTYEPNGDVSRQAELRDEGVRIARELVERWRACGPGERPEVWFSYHVYYKAPDWIGPLVCEGLGIPYVIAEASYAPKRAGGGWEMGHSATREAVRRAALVVCPIRDDVGCLEPLVSPPGKVVLLPPFLDAEPYRAAARARAAHRDELAATHALDPAVPWIVVAAMMRDGDKKASYQMLADELGLIVDAPWQVVVAGDGDARAGIVAALESAAPGRTRFLGECSAERLAGVYAACDLCAWPAVNEAYGMALLEAQAVGVPVVSRAVRGVPDVVRDGSTGLLAPAGERGALAKLMRALITDGKRRSDLGRSAARFVADERSIPAAAAQLGEWLRDLPAARRE